MARTDKREKAKGTRPRGWKLRLFRFVAIFIGLLPFVLFEIVLRIGGWGLPDEINDPYIGFNEVHPLFVRSGERFEVAETRRHLFCNDSFAAKKGDNEFRIFCLGGSTVQGRPYEIQTSFTAWLELSLQAADPSRDWEVVNCGGVSYASYRLVPIMRELLVHEPDLFIIYTGHNEFLENRTYQEVRETPVTIAQTHSWMSRFRTYNLLRRAWMDLTGKTKTPPPSHDTLPGEVDAMLDYEDGLKDYHRDDDWRDAVVKHFQFNLFRMIHIADRADVPVVLLNPISNLKDCPPFKFETNDSLSDQQVKQFDDLWRRSGDCTDLRVAAQLLEQAIRIDGRHAGAHFRLAKCYETLEQFDKAREAFHRAKEEDICPLRMRESMHEIVHSVARQTRTPLVDVRRMFEQKSPHGIPGDEMLIDHIHPKIDGHKMIAEALMDELVRLDIVRPRDGWETNRDASYREHLDRLNPAYFEHGQQRLAGLRRWTEGRSKKVRRRAPAE